MRAEFDDMKLGGSHPCMPSGKKGRQCKVLLGILQKLRGLKIRVSRLQVVKYIWRNQQTK